MQSKVFHQAKKEAAIREGVTFNLVNSATPHQMQQTRYRSSLSRWWIFVMCEWVSAWTIIHPAVSASLSDVFIIWNNAVQISLWRSNVKFYGDHGLSQSHPSKSNNCHQRLYLSPIIIYIYFVTQPTQSSCHIPSSSIQFKRIHPHPLSLRT